MIRMAQICCEQSGAHRNNARTNWENPNQNSRAGIRGGSHQSRAFPFDDPSAGIGLQARCARDPAGPLQKNGEQNEHNKFVQLV